MPGEEFDHVVALVTGGNRGLGDAFVSALVDGGATVYRGARSPEPSTDPLIRPLKLDVTDAADIERLASASSGLTMLINNAGIHEPTDVLDPSSAEIAQRVLAVNTVGMIAVTAAVQHQLVENGGIVINVLSAGSWLSGGTNLAYSASKAASLSVSNAMRTTLNPLGVQVTSMHAGFIDTDMMAGFRGPKLSARAVATETLRAALRGRQEVLIDDMSRGAKAHSTDEIADFERPRGLA